MSALEWRAGLSLASLFALRMLGLFLILPVFAVHAATHLAGGDNKTLVGAALGAYGLTQGILQIPFGMASDRFGRKPVIVFGLVLFAVGSFVAAGASDIWVTILGRCLQGAGAISAAVMALAADLTRDEHRTKIMAMIGASIGLTFALSLVAAPALYRGIGMGGMFELIGALAIAAIAVALYLVPSPPAEARGGEERRVEAASLRGVLTNTELLRLNVGIFVLHMVQVAIFVVIPLTLVHSAGLDVQSHWKLYLPAVLISFVLMMPPIMAAEKRGRIRELFLATIGVMLLVQIGFAAWVSTSLSAVVLAATVLLTVFFFAFNILEATLPSLVTRIAPVSARGTAIGVYNTTQALGLAAGGVLGGWLAQHLGNVAVFVFGIAAVALWLLCARGMRAPGQLEQRTLRVGSVHNHQDLREKLVRLRGVRDVSFDPVQGIAILQVYAEQWDEQAVLDIIGGSA